MVVFEVDDDMLGSISSGNRYLNLRRVKELSIPSQWSDFEI